MTDREKQIKERQDLIAKQNIEARRIAKIRRQKQAGQISQPVPSFAEPLPKPSPALITVPTCDPSLHDHTAYIVAGGPSLKGFNWKLLDNVFTVGINRAYEVLPTADVIYFTDEDFYSLHIENMKKHPGRLIKGCTNVKHNYDKKVEKFQIKAGKGLNMTPGILHHGRNSTYAAMNMLVQWGFKQIYLLGADMKWGKPGDKSSSHWHDGHKRIDGEATYKSFAQSFTDALVDLDLYNVKVINVNDNTNLTAFPVVSYQEHFKLDPIPSST